MVIDSDPPPILSDDFPQPTMTYSPFPSPFPVPVFDSESDDLLPQAFSTSQSPAIHPHDGVSDADDSESIGHSSSQSTLFFDDSSPADTADESPATCTFTDYHLILNGKFIHPISSVLYSTD